MKEPALFGIESRLLRLAKFTIWADIGFPWNPQKILRNGTEVLYVLINGYAKIT